MSPLTIFARDKLDIKIWSKIEEIFDAFKPEDGPGHRKILVRSCNGAGKTTALAAICNWYLSTHEDSIVLTTASSWTQVKRNLWGEIRKQARKAKLYLDENGNPLKLAETIIKLNDKHFMVGISPKIPENAMGFHAPHILVAVDEATGVDHEIMDALMGNLSGSDSQIIMICNPLTTQSYPYQAEISGEWKIISISAFDHPNVKDNNEDIAGAVTRNWVADMFSTWANEVDPESAVASKTFHLGWLNKWFSITPTVKARIFGQWADLSSDGFITMEMIKQNISQNAGINGVAPLSESIAIDKMNSLNAELMAPMPPQTIVPELKHNEKRTWSLGVDISRGVGKDATVYAFFDGNVQQKFEVHRGDDLMTTAMRIKAHYFDCQADGIDLIIAIDDTGIGGGVTDRLREEKVHFHAVNFGSKPLGIFTRKEMRNVRAEMYFVLHQELLEGSIKLNDDKDFHQELTAVNLDMNENATSYKMEDKKITTRRLGRSPDYADATALARYALRLEAMKSRDWDKLMGIKTQASVKIL